MLDNNTNRNSGFFNRPFGLNVQVPTRTIQQAKETASRAVSNLWEPVVDYFEKADNVFSGDVQKEINKYYSMAYSLGQTVRKGQPTHSFNMKV